MNAISITFLVIGCILAKLIFVLIIFKWFQRKSEENDIKNIGAVSKQINKFVATFPSNKDELLFHNISFKNKFSKKQFSVIPAMVVKGNNIFIITDIISSKKADQIIFTGEDVPYLVKGKKIIDLKNINYQWYEEIKEYLKSEFGDKYNIEVVCPILDNSLVIINNEDRNVCYLSEIKEYIDQKSKDIKINKDEKEKIVRKMLDINLSEISRCCKAIKSIS